MGLIKGRGWAQQQGQRQRTEPLPETITAALRRADQDRQAERVRQREERDARRRERIEALQARPVEPKPPKPPPAAPAPPIPEPPPLDVAAVARALGLPEWREKRAAARSRAAEPPPLPPPAPPEGRRRLFVRRPRPTDPRVLNGTLAPSRRVQDAIRRCQEEAAAPEPAGRPLQTTPVPDGYRAILESGSSAAILAGRTLLAALNEQERQAYHHAKGREMRAAKTETRTVAFDRLAKGERILARVPAGMAWAPFRDRVLARVDRENDRSEHWYITEDAPKRAGVWVWRII